MFSMRAQSCKETMEMIVYGEGATMFSNEELRGITNIEKGPNYIAAKCVLKSQDHGELPGRLMVFPEGKLEISCECYPGCPKDTLSPRSFMKHCESRQPSNWKNRICIIDEEDKRVPLKKTPLLKYYYKERLEGAEGTLRPPQAIHRDEFVRCSECRKERRFRLRTTVECRACHDALAKVDWTCSDHPYEKITCEDPEERKSRKASRRCPESIKCSGCMSCVCIGCGMCRFKDCPCRVCIDFVQNVGDRVFESS
ncbi:protein ULTRAPETALA 2-like isoform X2 [Actinidia eriantha]|uniref:protein ULTRAPETALA 2-like isoform X2 n=1 Tax=Actinidia eriantha TaxID=165200 RepID=UPI0025880600|nr:protein ULTRAPETALA 2-like isoform X2 [Actinidia eriantha]